jgi:hypothetical protein
MYWC